MAKMGSRLSICVHEKGLSSDGDESLQDMNNRGPVVYPLKTSDSRYQEVETEFSAKWSKENATKLKVEAILEIVLSPALIAIR